jgi:hypothetical protein
MKMSTCHSAILDHGILNASKPQSDMTRLITVATLTISSSREPFVANGSRTPFRARVPQSPCRHNAMEKGA